MYRENLTSNSKKPLISVIVVTYNAEKSIKRTLESVIKQKYILYEILIIDGLSKDKTIEIVEEYKKYIALVVSERDYGIYDAMNKGIKYATGDIIYFLNAGDELYDKDVFEKVASEFPADIIYGNVYSEKENIIYNGEYNKFKLAITNPCHQAIFYSKKIMNKYGEYNLRYKLFADYEYNIRSFFNKKTKLRYIDIIIASYDGDGVSKHFDDEIFNLEKGGLIKKYLGVIPYLVYELYRYKVKIYGKNKYSISNTR